MKFDLSYMSPELILAVGGMLVLAASLRMRKWSAPGRITPLSPEVIALVVLAAALVPSFVLLTRGHGINGIAQFTLAREDAGYGLWAVDGMALFFKIIALVSTAIVVFLAIDYFRGIRFHRGEFYSLLVFATLAITSLAASTDLIMIYLSLEFLSITSYVLAGYLKQDPRSNEAAVKYFLYGAISAAVMLYGMSILYGLTGTTSILGIADTLRSVKLDMSTYHVLFISLLMVLAGFGFKIAMVPFHQWSPDTYEGAPTPITAFLSVGSKAAGFAVLLRVLATGIAPDVMDWTALIILFSGVTMTVGNLVAIPQLNIKRMLAYSSIAQAGYLLLGVAAMPYSRLALPAVLLYILIYLFMNLGAFAVVTIVSARLNSDDIRSYAGLIRRAPFAAVAMVVFLLSLAGIPPTAGFLAKFYLFLAAVQADDPTILWLVILALANTVVSIYYYMNVVRYMFFVPAKDTTPIAPSRLLNAVVGVTLAVTLLGLLYAPPFVKMAELSAKMIAGI